MILFVLVASILNSIDVVVVTARVGIVVVVVQWFPCLSARLADSERLERQQCYLLSLSMLL